MKKAAALILMLTLLILNISCAKSESTPPATSIRADFKESYDFTIATLDATLPRVAAGKLAVNDVSFLDKQLATLSGLIPISGLTESQQFDNLVNQESEWKFNNSQPTIRIDQVEIWAMCPAATTLPTARVYENGNQLFEIVASGVSYTSSSPSFDYDRNPAQYKSQPNAFISSGSTLSIQTDIGNGCPIPRKVVHYSQFDGKTLSALNAWRAQIVEIRSDLVDLKSDTLTVNYPVSYQLQKIREKLNKAYSALP